MTRTLRELIAAPHPDAGPLPPAAERPAGVRVLRGVPYGVLEGSRPLELDLWLPPAPRLTRPSPVLLFVHGGAWRRGRRDDMGLHTRAWDPGPFERIAAAGFTVACVDYRLSGEATFPAPLADLRTALPDDSGGPVPRQCRSRLRSTASAMAFMPASSGCM
ncbi:hypothetical protein ACFRAO_44540 [Streptomyces sp. NPDC056656]|uniref:hypothetical protein n=1 Tax=Streptomyces sp. NPDC056656 TaxID=3345895 RepID=UPI0036B16BAC